MLDSLDLQPVEQRTLSDGAADRIRSAIRNGTLAPGTRLIERDLAERMGMSRIPVREAIQRLVEEGIVRKLPHRGAVVYIPTREEIEEISSLRVVLERFIAERVISRWSDAHEQVLRQIVEEMRQAALQRDLQQVGALDYRFHLILWQIADHTLLLEVISGLRSRINRFLYEANGALTTAELDMHINGHNELIDVIKSGDLAAAQAAFVQHVSGAKERILAYCNLPESGGNQG